MERTTTTSMEVGDEGCCYDNNNIYDDNDDNDFSETPLPHPPYFNNPLFKYLNKYILQTEQNADNDNEEDIHEESLSIILNACGKSFLENIPIIEKYEHNTDDYKVYRQQTSNFSLDDESFVQLKQSVSQTLYEKYGPSPPLFSSTLITPVSSFSASYSKE